MLTIDASLQPQQTDATTYYGANGTRDTCNRLNFQVTESGSCNRLTAQSGVGAACTVPNSSARNNVTSYAITVAISSNDGQPHTLSYHTSNSFCTNGYLNYDSSGYCICVDNDQRTTGTLAIPASGSRTFTLSRSSPSGNACGSYQLDFGGTAVDGNTSCTYGVAAPGGVRVGVSGLCETGTTCSATVPTPTPSTYTITGRVFEDVNRNGVREGSESLIDNVPMSHSGVSSGSTTTSSGGVYSFINLSAGSYTVRISLPAGYIETTPASQATTVGPNRTIDFGIVRSGFGISGTIFLDANRNGVKNGGEAGYQGATINLSGEATNSTISYAGGMYTFGNLFAGDYTVRLTVPAGYDSTTPTSQATSVGPNRTIDFGIAQRPLVYTISGSVYTDTNQNGTQDTGEPNFSGTPNITATRGGAPIGAVATSPGGVYTISNITEGAVRVSHVTMPTGYGGTYPQVNPPQYFDFVVGPNCDTNGARGVTCY